MLHHRILFWPCASLAMAVLLAVSIATTGRGSFQAPRQSATGSAQDPFQVAEKAAADSTGKTDKKSEEKKKAEPEFVRKTEEEWAKILHPAVFRVTRWKETEPAFSGKYATGHYRGTFILRLLQRRAVQRGPQVRFRDRMAELLAADLRQGHCERDRQQRGRATHRGDVPALRRPPGPRLRR